MNDAYSFEEVIRNPILKFSHSPLNIYCDKFLYVEQYVGIHILLSRYLHILSIKKILHC